MTILLSTNHPTYLRRLARELNSLPDGFYFDASRYQRARYSAKTNQIIGKSPSGWTAFSFPTSSADEFIDAYGRTVHASRSARHARLQNTGLMDHSNENPADELRQVTSEPERQSTA